MEKERKRKRFERDRREKEKMLEISYVLDLMKNDGNS